MKKRKLKLKKKAIVIITFLLVVLLFFILHNFVFSDKSKLLGSWTTDNTTIYKFNRNNTGKLIVSLSEYDFKYKIKNNKLYIDFENEKSEDSEYEYNFKNKRLILSNDKGIFTFTKK